MKRRIDRWVSLWLFHIAIKTTQALNKTALDCEMRLLAMKYAQKIQPWRRFPADPLFRQLHDALQLENLCHIPPPLDHKDDSTTNEVEFTCASKHCLRVGYIQPPFLSFSTVHEALEFSSNILRDPHHTTIILGEGIHSLKSTINLQKQDSGLSIVGYPGRDVWLSGALEIPADTKWSYDCSVNLNVRVANLTNLLNNHPLPRLPSLFSTHKRWNRARYPNGDVETTQWGYQSPGRFNHSIPADQVLEWHRPPPGRVPDFTYVDLTHYAAAPKNDSIMPGYNVYASGRGGVCADLWGPYVDSYWCSNASAGGWSEVDRECAVTGQLQIPVGLSYNASSPLGQRLAVWKSRAHGGIIHAWHSQTWAMHMFEIASTFIHNDMVTLWFAKGGGKQGGRNWCRCDQCTYAGPWCGQHQNPSVDDSRLVSGSWLVENVLSELDDPGEYFFETKSKLLYVYPNKTAADKSGLQGLRLAVLEELITIGEGAMNISIQGIGFRDTAATYMGEWGIPSGGDWALHRGGAVFIQKASNILIENCPFERLDGNAIFLSGRTRNVTIRRNTFAWIGENAIATWGDTDGFNALAGDYPIHTVVEGNVMRELGLYQKQSSGIAQNKAALTTIRHNIIFNVPRALTLTICSVAVIQCIAICCLTFADGDHGAINTWDRQPFLTDLKDGVPSFTPRMRKIWFNFIFANYGAGWGLDNDDGSSWYHVRRNVFYASQGFKMDYGGHDSVFRGNLVITFPSKWRQMCIDFGGFLPLHGHMVVENTCIVPGEEPIMIFSTCQHSNVVSARNRYFTPSGNATVICGYGSVPVSLTKVQHFGLEKGSTVQRNPSQIYPILALVMKHLFQDGIGTA